MDTPNPMESLSSIMKAHLTWVQTLRLQLNRHPVAMALWRLLTITSAITSVVCLPLVQV